MVAVAQLHRGLLPRPPRALPTARQHSAELRHGSHASHKLGHPECARLSIGRICVHVCARMLLRLLQQWRDARGSAARALHELYIIEIEAADACMHLASRSGEQSTCAPAAVPAGGHGYKGWATSGRVYGVSVRSDACCFDRPRGPLHRGTQPRPGGRLYGRRSTCLVPGSTKSVDSDGT